MMNPNEAAAKARDYLDGDHPIPVEVGRALLTGYEQMAKLVETANQLICGAIERYEYDGSPCAFEPCEYCEAGHCLVCRRFDQHNADVDEFKVQFKISSPGPGGEG